MQRVQPRELSESISWARALIFGVGFFFITALLIGQLPGFIFDELTASTLQGMEQGSLALALVSLLGFFVVEIIVLLFDPKPVLPPVLFVGLGVVLFAGGLALLFWSVLTTSTVAGVTTNNQYFPQPGFYWNPISQLDGNVLWLEPGAVDLVMVSVILLIAGAAGVFYGSLALREQRNPDRSDLGTTPAIRLLIALATLLLLAYMFFTMFVDPNALAAQINPACATAINPARGCGVITGLFVVNAIEGTLLGVAVCAILGAFALRLHYLMRPVRKRVMAPFYAVGVNLLPFGIAFLLLWFFLYPLLAWIHSWSLVGLGDWLTVCSKKSVVPGSCTFSQQAGYIVDAFLTMNFFVVLMAAVRVWRTRRNLVIMGSFLVAAVLALATLVTHLSADQALIALLLCGGSLVMVTIWTSVARREFAVVGERNLGCIGQWLVVGTCLFVYIASFAFFSIPGFHETEPNITFAPGILIPGKGSPDAVIVFILMGILAAIQFYFLVRNRYKV
jgi:hypothetical protein